MGQMILKVLIVLGVAKVASLVVLETTSVRMKRRRKSVNKKRAAVGK